MIQPDKFLSDDESIARTRFFDVYTLKKGEDYTLTHTPERPSYYGGYDLIVNKHIYGKTLFIEARFRDEPKEEFLEKNLMKMRSLLNG